MITRIFLAACLFLGIPFVAGAVTFESDPLSNQVGVGQLAAFTLYLDTEGDAVNALNGVISYNTEKLKFKSVVDGDSVITVWLKQLTTEGSGQLSFSGIIPGGFEGSKGKLFTLYFTALEPGDSTVAIAGDAYHNDGEGTRVTAHPTQSGITIVEEPVAGAVSEIPDTDSEGPHSIKAVIAQNEAMFGGKPFIIVDAKDSTSGIERYELLQSEIGYPLDVLEKDPNLRWKTINNPEALESPLAKYLYVRAIDRAGNATVVEVFHEEQLSPERDVEWLNGAGSFGILVGGLVILFLLYRLSKPSHA